MQIGEAEAAMAQIDQDWLKNPRQNQNSERAADDDNRERALRLRTDTRRDRGRQQAERIYQIGHHGSAQAPIRSHYDCLKKGMALIP